mmetsp:Transcript_13805/g.15873  ORF Transcript_13805/g.15873 Transcript_13805/m.15873 type:complete len:106 (-) Transcript_13805:12-329(-)
MYVCDVTCVDRNFFSLFMKCEKSAEETYQWRRTLTPLFSSKRDQRVLVFPIVGFRVLIRIPSWVFLRPSSAMILQGVLLIHVPRTRNRRISWNKPPTPPPTQMQY